MPNIHVLIILMGLLLGRDLGRQDGGVAIGSPMQFAVAAAWCALIAIIALIALPACARAVGAGGRRSLVAQGLGLAGSLRWLLVLPYAAWSVSSDAVGTVEAMIGSWIGLDEALAGLPPLLALIAICWAEHPLHDRVRHAMMIRQLDEGGLVERPPSRFEATLSATRSMLAMPLAPVMLIVCWHETVEVLLRDAEQWVLRGVDAAGTIAIVLAAPAIIVHVLGARAIQEGDLARRISELGAAMGTRVRGLRLWTHGSANAALLGVLPLARYLLVTDRLVRGAPRHELDAVLAHELAHARQHHVLWILLAVLSAVGVLGIVQAVMSPWVAAPSSSFAEGAWVLVSVVLTFAWFGFVSRIIERQADAHAAVAIGREVAQAQDKDLSVVHPAGPACMAAALDRVCALNGADRLRWGFRHGSIAQRQRALASLPGTSIDRLPVDRRVRRIKLATLLGLVATAVFLALGLLQGWFG